MKVKKFTAGTLTRLEERLQEFFDELEKDDYSVWHISNIAITTTRGIEYFGILIFYDEELDVLSPS